MNLADRQELRRIEANARARAKRAMNPKTGRNGRNPALTVEQAKQIKDWATLGRNMADVARNMGLSVKTVQACVNGQHKKPYRTA